MTGRYEASNYAEGYEGDYYIVTDAIDEHLDEFLHDDDIAEPAIYAAAIEQAGAVLKLVLERNRDNTECILCQNGLLAGDNADWHTDDCPLRRANTLVDASWGR